MAGSPVYNTFFRRNYQMLAAVFAGGFAFELFYNQGMNRVWDKINRGRQWKDIRGRYAEAVEEDEE